MMMPKYKGKEINTKPSEGMVAEARRGLEWRKEHGRGGTEVGVARARDISNGKELSLDTVKRMRSFFARHEVDKQAEGFSPGEDGYPSAGRIAWALWGGDAGQSWANKIVKSMDAADERQEELGMDDEKDINEIVDEIEANGVPSAEVEDAEERVEAEAEERFESADIEHRAMALDMSPVDEEKRTARIAISSEEPVERSFGKEVLEHSAEAIDLSFLASGRAPLLLDHDPEKQIGVIESVDLDDSARRLRATVRFGRNGLAKEAFDDVVDGIRANISVGYAIKKMEKDKRSSDTYIAKSWRPVEASLVSIPADVTVGLGRSDQAAEELSLIHI